MLLNNELVTNGTFTGWSGDNPNSWTLTGESGSNPEISEVGTGEGHGGSGTGYCNLYTTGDIIKISQSISYVVGRKYRVSLNINKRISGALRVADSVNNQWTTKVYSSTGIKTFTFIATVTSSTLLLQRNAATATDITFDDVSIRQEVGSELSRMGHRFSSFPEN